MTVELKWLAEKFEACLFYKICLSQSIWLGGSVYSLLFLGFFSVSNYDQDRRRCRHGPSGLQCTDPGSPTVQTQKRSQRGVYI